MKFAHDMMKKLAACAAVLAAAGVAEAVVAAESADAPASISASEAFVHMPAKTLDLLTTSMRKDLLDYYRNDSIYRVKNAMDGESYIIAPVTHDYMKVQVTPVTTLTVRILPAKKGPVVMTIYTIGDSLQAHDSEVRFYDAALDELPRDKYMKLASTADFIIANGLKKSERAELESLVPFPTVEYEIGPDSASMTARLTVGKYLGKETMDKLTPHLDRTFTYQWKGGKFVK